MPGKFWNEVSQKHSQKTLNCGANAQSPLLHLRDLRPQSDLAEDRLRGALRGEGSDWREPRLWSAYYAFGILLGTYTVLFYLISIMTLQVSFIFPSGK